MRYADRTTRREAGVTSATSNLLYAVLAVCGAVPLLGCAQRNHIAPAGFYRDFELYGAWYDRPQDKLYVSLTTGWYLPQNVTTGRPESPGEHDVSVAPHPTWAKGLASLPVRVHGFSRMRKQFLVRFPIYQAGRQRQLIALRIEPLPDAWVELDGETIAVHEANRSAGGEAPHE